MEPCPHCGETEFRDAFLRKRHVMGCSSNPEVVARRGERERQEARQAASQAARHEQVRAVLEGRRPLLRLRSPRVPRSLLRPIELAIWCAPERPGQVEAAVLDGAEVPLVQVGGCGVEGRGLELPGMVVDAVVKQLDTVVDAGFAGAWEVRWLAYWTHRENQTLVLTVPVGLERVEYRYEFEDTS